MKSLPKAWIPMTVADVCDMRNGHGFGPEDWGTTGLPIIRIQNLNGGQKFDYFSGQPEERWLVEPGQMLFSWAGTKGVSFGPTIWRGTRGVLNQHIFKVQPKDNIDGKWLYWALKHVTERIEAQSHGFKATLVHVKKSDIDRQFITVPPLNEQRRIAQVLAIWDQTITNMERVLVNSQRQKQALSQHLLSDRPRKSRGRLPLRRELASSIFSPRSVRRNDGLELLSVMQDVGVVPRSSLDRKVVMPEGSTDGYKLVEPGDFVISLRSFEGGLEYSKFKGLVSPAYTVLKPNRPIVDDFYRHYFKSREFIGRLAVAVIGIRDGKQISYDDFAFLKLPYPSMQEQQLIATVLTAAEQTVQGHEADLQLMRNERAVLMSQLLTGKRRIKLPEAQKETQA